MLQGVAIAGRTGHSDIQIEDSRIASLVPSQARNGGFVTPLFADIHVHLDKTFTIRRIAENGDAKVDCLFDAIDLMNTDRKNWSEADIRARATQGLQAAFEQGVGAMRSHVDWTTPEVPTAWPVLNELRQEWKDRLDLQLAALVHGDLVLDAGSQIAARVAKDGGVFGAFFYRNADLEAKIEEMFRVAVQHDLNLDFHVDEGLEVEADGFSLIVSATRHHGMGGRVLCGHACSLSLRGPDELQRILDAAADAGTALVSLPTTNLYLQDRIGEISAPARCVAPLKEARAAGAWMSCSALTMLAMHSTLMAIMTHSPYCVLQRRSAMSNRRNGSTASLPCPPDLSAASAYSPFRWTAWPASYGTMPKTLPISSAVRRPAALSGATVQKFNRRTP